MSEDVNYIKEQLRICQNNYKELKEIYDTDIESKEIIEKILRKNYEESKNSYENQILKLKKNIEMKENEINELKEHYNNVEVSMLNKIKEDNKKNIEKIKSLYEAKLLANNLKISNKENSLNYLNYNTDNNNTNNNNNNNEEIIELKNENYQMKIDIEEYSKKIVKKILMKI